MRGDQDHDEHMPLQEGDRASSMYPSSESTTSSLEPIKQMKKFVAKQLRHKWLRLDAEGSTTVLQTGKHALTQRLGVQARDLRLLDAQPASSPPAILCRDRAVVVNLEFIKCIITSGYALVLDSGEGRMTSFVEELQRRLRLPAGAAQGLPDTVNSVAAHFPVKKRDEAAPPAEADRAADSAHLLGDSDTDSIFGDDRLDENGSQYGGQQFRQHLGRCGGLSDISEEMQFELRVLEAVLDYVTAFMEHLASDLESVAYPGLDAIVIKVTERRLDRLRTVKSRLARLTSRVETVRELLERLLEDDDNMRDINLTARMKQDIRMRALRSLSGTGSATPEAPPALAMPSAFEIIQENERDKDQVEQLLETYFMNLDNTYNKLQTLGEYIEDTEDYIQFDLDTKRNKFIEYRVLIIICTFAVTIVSTLYNIFGMNLGLNEAWRQSYAVFLETVLVSVFGGIVVAGLIVWYCRQKRILCY